MAESLTVDPCASVLVASKNKDIDWLIVLWSKALFGLEAQWYQKGKLFLNEFVLRVITSYVFDDFVSHSAWFLNLFFAVRCKLNDNR